MTRSYIFRWFFAAFFLLCLMNNGYAQKPSKNQYLEIKPLEKVDFYKTANMRMNNATGTPVAVYRPNYPVKNADAESMARQYLSENASLFKMNKDLKDLKLHAIRKTTAGYHVRFNQYFNQYPVHNSDIVVTINSKNLVTFVMNNYKPNVTIANKSIVVSKEQARSKAFDYLKIQGRLDFEKTETVVYVNNNAARIVQKVVLVPAESVFGDWETLVDAQTGQIIRVEDKAQYSGDGKKATTTGIGKVFDPDPLTTSGQTYTTTGYGDNNDADSDSLTLQLKTVVLNDITKNGSNYILEGPYCKIIDFESPAEGDSIYTRQDSLFNYTRARQPFEGVNVYYHVDKSMRYINQTLGVTVMPIQYTGGPQVDPHGLNGDDNSHYIPSTGRIAWGEGGVDDAEDAAVILHELMHGIHDWASNGGLSQTEGLSEGSCDYWIQSYVRSFGLWQPTDPEYNWVFIWDGHNSFWSGRTTNLTEHYPEGLNGDIYHDGDMWATTLMQIYNDIGRTATDKNLVVALAMTNSSTNQEDAAQAFIQADLENFGGAHFGPIEYWFTQRGYDVTIPYQPADPMPVTNAAAYSDYTMPTSMTLTWTDPLNFGSGTPLDTFLVDIYRNDTLRGTVPKGTETFTENGLTDGVQWIYNLIVRHYPTDSTSTPVATAAWYVGGHPTPKAPTALDVTGNTTSAMLTWTNPTENLDGTPINDLAYIRIYRDGVQIDSVAATGNTYTDIIYTLDGAYYTYKVQAVDNETPVNVSGFSNEDQVYVGPVPEISVSPDSLFFNLVTGLSDTSSYWIYNTGGDTLKISGIEAEEITPAEFVPKWTQEQKFTPEYPKGAKEPTFGRVTEAKGGPDPFGYKWIDSDEPGGPTFNWYDISSIGTALTFSNVDDGYADVTIPFAFKYYGSTYTQARVRTNGWIGFDMASTLTSYSNAAIPASATPNLAIYPFWDDMDLGDGGTVYYYYDAGSNRFIIQYHGVVHYGGSGTYTYQILLYPSGKIVYQYLTMSGTLNSATIGIENSTGAMGLQCVYNANYVHNNMAIVFQKSVDWLSQSPTTGNVPPGDSLLIQAIVNATGLVGATYNAKAFIHHNIPLQAAYEHPLISMLVTGATDIGVTPDTLDFGSNFITISDTLQFTVSNIGTDTLHVSGMVNDSLQFTILGPTAYDIPVGGSRAVKVVFTSAVAGSYEDIVTITSDGSSGTKHVHLFGQAVEMPQLSVLPDSLYFNIDPAMVDSAYFGLFNTGLGSLSVTGIEAEEITSEGAFAQPQKYTPDYPKGAVEPTFGEQTEGSGGPDPFGYKWKDSDAPGGPTFSWYDISSTGTTITGWLGSADDGRAKLMLPFGFKFYGNTYNHVWVGTNGFISFADTLTTSYLTNAAIPATALPNNIIGGMWDDLNTTSGWVKYYHDVAGNRFVIQYNAVDYGTTNQWLFQFVLYPSGKILIQYLTKQGTATDYTVGIENADGTMGLQVAYNQNYVHDNLAIEISKGVDWLTLNPLTGTIASGDSMMVKALVNSTGLSNGVYKARLIIGSNDPVTPTQYAKVTLNVGTVDVDPDNLSGPTSYALHQNYPNPFNPTTTIKYDLKDAGKVTLKVYNILGQEVRTLVNTNEMAGFRSVVWDGKDNAGKAVSSGLYIYRLETGKFAKSHKMMLLK